jgi:electron transport complex protein RnfB
MATLADRIDALLPQTQCRKCGYDGCRPYAEAIAAGSADIDRCPPGGTTGIRRLARLLGREEKPLNPGCGTESPRAAALIDESRCIGCTLCIEACPVDAIAGGAKRMHTVLTAWCNGCDLCLPPCPVDCIEMVPLEELARKGHVAAAWLAMQPLDEMSPVWRERHAFRKWRLKRAAHVRGARLADRARTKLAELEREPAGDAPDRKKAAIRAALERARARRDAGGHGSA